MADINKALAKVFGIEGGYVFDKDDPGGETKYGICKRSYPHINIKLLTLEKAAAIYLKDFWSPLGLDRIENQTIAEEVFDTAVNCGRSAAAKMLQEAINLTAYPEKEIVVDGQIGPITIGKVNGHNSPISLYKALNGLQVEHYMKIVRNRPIMKRFFRGWLKRVFEAQI